MPVSFIERLAQGPILCDGAMGTQLYAKGIPFEHCFDELNLSRPALIKQVHEEYIRAGSEIIETNTFGANRYKLGPHGHREHVAKINASAVRLAHEIAHAAERRVFVAASVGPLGAQLAPVGALTRQEAHEAFLEQVAALASEEPDALVLETFTDLVEITEAINAARQVCNLPIIAQMTFTDDGVTPLGYTAIQVANALSALKVDVIGVNCSMGPAKVLPVISQMIQSVREAACKPNPIYFSAQPNAGFPEAVRGRVFYPSTAEYFGEYARRFVDAGVNLVGGCCGTTADHTAAMRVTLGASFRLRPSHLKFPSGAPPRKEESPSVPEAPSLLQQYLDAGRFIVSVEVDPPRGYAVDAVLVGARTLKRGGADVINIADSPRAQMRMSAWALAHLVGSEVGIETVLHFPVRGRNLLRVHGDLLAAHALDVRNILAVMGDPPALGDYPGASDTYDLVPSGLTKLIKHNFSRGVDKAGMQIGPPCSFTVGVALDLNPRDAAREIKTLHSKVLAGADFALTQPVFDPLAAHKFLERYEEEHGPVKLPLLVGILPLSSERHAEFLHNEVPGITLTDAVRERMRRAGTDARSEGLRIANELWLQMRDVAQGVYLMPPFGHYDVCVELLAALKESVST
jgi:methionine synthase / methylenetetrahydrofolate reductase (NADH)